MKAINGGKRFVVVECQEELNVNEGQFYLTFNTRAKLG